jgi:hypothetical protein
VKKAKKAKPAKRKSPAKATPLSTPSTGTGTGTEDRRFAAMVADLRTTSSALRAVVSDYEAARKKAGNNFGKNALRADGKIFAMMTQGQLILKLPQERVDALIADGEGAPFDANKGKPMKQWVTIRDASKLSWSALAREAHAFVTGQK